MTESDHGAIDLAKEGPQSRAEIAHAALSEVFGDTTIPLQKLGYTYSQLQFIAPIMEAVIQAKGAVYERRG